MARVYLHQIVPEKEMEMTVEIVTSSSVNVPIPLEVPFRLDGVEFGTAVVTGANTSLHVDFGGLYMKVLAVPGIGYDMFTKRSQDLSFTIPGGRVVVGGITVNRNFNMTLPLYLAE
eukprot:jgi/Mesvir1/9138/Mv14388-RA.1